MMVRARRWGMALLMTAVVVATAACTTSGGSGGGELAAASEPAMVQVTLVDFSIQPSMIDVPSGRDLMFHVQNTGEAPHTFGIVVDGTTLETPEIAAGSASTLDVPALDVGSYDVRCTVPGHDQLGMVGTVVAAEGGADGSTSSTGTAAMDHSLLSAEQMATLHEEVMNAFPQETVGTGNRPLEGEVVDGVKVFTLTATQVDWEVSAGVTEPAMAFNGQIPGPQLEVDRGDRVRIILQNQMDQPTILHLHGVTLPNSQDGVPYITQPAVMPGEYWTYEFTVKDPPGMYVYHSHFNSTEQVGKGLYGAMIVRPDGSRWPYPGADVSTRTGAIDYTPPPRVMVESTLFLGDGPLGYTLNGKSFPATQPIVADRGDWVLIHMANDGAMLHPMHLHGYHFEVVAQDGFPLQGPYLADTLTIAPGQRFDVLVHAVHPGTWAFHCHILPHVEGPEGMFGMVTALVVQ